MNIQTKQKFQIVSPLVIAAIMLFVALRNMPGNYYTALRIIVAAASVNSAIIAYRFDKKMLMFPFIAIAIIFNPLVPLGFGRHLWVVIDIVCGLFFIVNIFLLKERTIPEVKEGQVAKKKFFTRPIFYIPVVLVIILVAFGGWQAWIAINGNEQLVGIQNEIPKPTGIIPPLETGESDLSRVPLGSNDWPNCERLVKWPE